MQLLFREVKQTFLDFWDFRDFFNRDFMDLVSQQSQRNLAWNLLPLFARHHKINS